jgi:protocatechuate 3,4-dioxygenase beta subunit
MSQLLFPSCPSRPFHLISLVVCALCVNTPFAHAQGGGVAGSVVSQPGGQPPRDTRPTTGRAAIRGRVLSDTGQPVRRAMVRVTAPEMKGIRATSTDADGRYEIRDLPAGRYSISASKPAFIAWSYGQAQPNGPPKPVVLTENQTADNIDVRIPRGAVITGRIIDEFGDPIPNVEVAPIRKTYSQGQRRLIPIGMRAQTNDIGEYRIFGLEPGQFYVGARAQNQNIPIATSNGFEFAADRSGFASTFYPATADIAAARALTVGVGQTIDGIDIALQPVPLATISGIAIDGQGGPLSGGGVSAIVRGAGTPALGLVNGPVNKDGTFRLPNVPPGEYVVRVTAQRPSPDGRPAGPMEFAVALVTINGEDVSGVTLVPLPTVTVTGRLVFDDAGAAQPVKPSAIRILTQPLGPDDGLLGFGGNAAPTIGDDFTFEFKTRPGRIGVRLAIPFGPNGTSGWQLKSIRVGGVDVTETGIDVSAAGLRDVEIEMTDRMQKISGTVTDAAGAAIRDYTVALFSQNRSQWAEPMGRRFAIGRPGETGGFAVMTLPPGEYFAIALAQLDLTDWEDPSTLEALSRLATPFVLTAGDTRTLDLRLVTTQ